MSILTPVLDPLVDTYVPSARTNETLKNDLLAHCQDILKRYSQLPLSDAISIKLQSITLVTLDREQKQISLISPTWLSADVRSELI